MKLSYDKLWKLLIDKKMKKGDLKEMAGISWTSITKMSKDGNVGTGILLKICEELNCDISDIVEFIPDNKLGDGKKNE